MSSFSCPLQILAGLLHLGNVRFADSADEAQPCQLMDDAKCEGKGLCSHTQGANIGGIGWEARG